MQTITLFHYCVLSFGVVTVVALGTMLNKTTFIKSLIAIELLLLAANINFLIAAKNFQDPGGYTMILAVLAIAAVEVVIGLALLVMYYKTNDNTDIKQAILLQE